MKGNLLNFKATKIGRKNATEFDIIKNKYINIFSRTKVLINYTLCDLLSVRIVLFRAGLTRKVVTKKTLIGFSICKYVLLLENIWDISKLVFTVYANCSNCSKLLTDAY